MEEGPGDDAAPLRDAERLPGLNGGSVVYYRASMLGPALAARCYASLRPGGPGGIAWERRTITVYGRQCQEGRDTAFYGDPGTSYRYSGKNHVPLPWTEGLRAIRAIVDAATGLRSNLVLMNFYRPGDSIGAHSDDERDLDAGTPIASVSLGEARNFILIPKAGGPEVHTRLAHGSLCVMAGLTQTAYKHRVDAEPGLTGDRVNLTFRRVKVRPVITVRKPAAE
jgi:alkylated DNA repair dioxygenase AlkB